MTFVVKLHVQWNSDGWTERKEEEIRPAKEWSSSIQRMPANFTVTTQNCFCFDLPVAFNAGPQEFCWFFWSTSYLKNSWLLWKPARLRVWRTRIGNHCCKHSLVLPKFSSWFPMTPLLQLPTLLFVVFVEDQWPWPPKPVSIAIALVFTHLTWLKMFSNIQTLEVRLIDRVCK